MSSSTGPVPLNGVAMPTWLLRYDQHGACTSPEMRAALLDRLHSAPPSDVIVFSHGWNNDADDATALYSAFLRHFEALAEAWPIGRRFEPLFVGLLWPSIWLSFDQGPAMASSTGQTVWPDSGLGRGQAEALLADQAGAISAAGGATAMDRLLALLAAPAIDDADAAELARLIAPAFGLASDEGAAQDGRNTLADDVLAIMRDMAAASPPAATARPPASDDLDDFSRPADADTAGTQPGGPSAAGGLGLLDPRNALRLLSIYRMKDRAGTVGFNGVSALLRDLLAVGGAAPQAEPMRVHALGHSFGCKVLLSAICAQPLPRPLASLLLLQPAISHLCFADRIDDTGQPGGYRATLSPQRVLPPIVSTYTRNDLPLHKTFHLAVRRAADLGEAQIASDDGATSAGRPPSRFAALGGYGPRQAGQLLVDPLPPAGSPIAWPQGDAASTPIVAFDGSQDVINGHGDIKGPPLAWLLHRLVSR